MLIQCPEFTKRNGLKKDQLTHGSNLGHCRLYINQLKARVGPSPDGEVPSASLNSLVISCKLIYHMKLASLSQRSFTIEATKSSFARYSKLLLPDD